MSKKPVSIKPTLRPTKEFSGNFRINKDVKHLKAGESIYLNVVRMLLSDKVQIYNESHEKTPFHIAINAVEFPDYFTEIL
jgi:hypothetical protein